MPTSIEKKRFYFLVIIMTCAFEIALFTGRELFSSKTDFNNGRKNVNSEIKIITYRADSNKNINNAWGYDIFLNGKLYIHQPYIPAINGNKCFSCEKDARRTAEFVVGKLRRHIYPPTVCKEELDYLGVIK